VRKRALAGMNAVEMDGGEAGAQSNVAAKRSPEKSRNVPISTSDKTGVAASKPAPPTSVRRETPPPGGVFVCAAKARGAAGAA
jgi:hypothetical protein